MYQDKKFGAEILFIPYFSPFGPPSHSPCLLVSAVTVTFLLEPPARNESSSSAPPSGNTNHLSKNSSQNPSLQLWYWQVAPICIFCTFIQYPEKPHLLEIGNNYQLQRRKHSRYTSSWKVAILLHFRSLRHFRSANKICNFWPSAERLYSIPHKNKLTLWQYLYFTCEIVLMVAPVWRSTFTTLGWP